MSDHLISLAFAFCKRVAFRLALSGRVLGKHCLLPTLRTSDGFHEIESYLAGKCSRIQKIRLILNERQTIPSVRKIVKRTRRSLVREDPG